ncbi:MAG: hypothetical protein LBE36_05080 [Flavobacteriaceae bacterium]|jgi:uncharacterized protein YfaS (alpha-2-macroglobulin family)|nr:hypothetical protein [Flavobacteriaceae bacterium]
MKNLKKIILSTLVFAGISTISAQNYYEQQWKKVEENYQKGIYKNNLPIILEIQNQAMKDKNTVQIIKSLKAEFSIVKQTQDDTQNNAASEFFAKLKPIETQFKPEDQRFYKTLLGLFFSEYYNNNSWKINQQTGIDQNNSLSFGEGWGEDIETWSKLDFKNFLSKNFEELLAMNSELKNIPLENYEDIFETAENFDYFPTLADWNANNYISFLQDSRLFTPNELEENREKIIAAFDDEIASNSGNPKLYFQHQKINYVYAYNERFEHLEKLVENADTDGDYKVLIIADMMNILRQKEDFKSALVWANNAKEQYPKSPFINNIINIESEIKNPNLNLFYETQTQTKKPIHIVVESKNVENFSLNIYEMKDDISGFLKYAYEYQTPFASVKKTLVKKENFAVNFPKDYKKHKTSLEIQPLPAGIYLAEILVENGVQETFYFIVGNSKIIYQTKSNQKNADVFKLVNNENGKPIASENLQITEYIRGENIAVTSAKTDAKGVFKFSDSKNDNYYRRLFLVKNSANDYNLIYVDDYDYNYETEKFNAQIFTDRAIYRPGQTVYFKVINTKIVNGKEVVNPKFKQEISLIDANYQEIATQKFVTNEFGSYNGSFVLPKGKLNGQFSLEIDDDEGTSGEKYFQVEEYKRPTFEVEFEKIKSEYKYGQTIELKGKAAMFSGVPLGNSTVNYEIKKQNIRWKYFWWYPPTYDNENSILGSVQTDEKGEFTIKIDLQKDEKSEGILVDNYSINASVTDINGETQSAEENVVVSSVSHYIEAEKIGNAFADESVKLKVETKNYSGETLQKPYNVKLSKLEEPNRIFRNNFQRQIQDFPSLSKEEFIQKFPHDKFDENDEQKNWKIQDTRIKTQEPRQPSTDKNVTLSEVEVQQPITNNQQPTTDNQLDLGKLSAGTYKLELFNIEGKDTIKTEQYFGVWDKNALGNSGHPFLKWVTNAKKIVRGENIKIFVYSAVPDALLNIFTQNGDGNTITETKKLNRGILEYEIQVPKDENISSLNVQFQLVAFNDVQTETVNLPIENSQNLKIETVTFRDKLQPATKEKWTVKISGKDGAKVSAEVLANMYDKSLDQFAANTFSWQGLPLDRNIFSDYKIYKNLDTRYYYKRYQYLANSNVSVPNFNWFDGRIYDKRNQVYPMSAYATDSASVEYESVEQVVMTGGLGIQRENAPAAPMEMALQGRVAGLAINFAGGKAEMSEPINLENIKIRQNLNETAFFYPNLLTDKDGNVSFEFTSPEALTAWKLMFLAHTKDAQAGVLEKEVITQKEFSVTPNYPRFLREGDEIRLQTKISSLLDKKLNGTAQLQILDAFTEEDISAKFNLNEIQKQFSVNENSSTATDWTVKVPNGVSSIIIKIVAKAGDFSDGEQKAIAILPNRMLVTDAVPIFVKEGQTKTFVLENLKNANSTTISNVSNTLELTTNPIWEIMFALPSLKNDVNNSADVVFNKWFADVLAAEIFKANPKLKTVFDEYQTKGLLTSNLEKNQELKQLLLEETPWVLDSKNEEEQMQKLARLFDANTMRNAIQSDWSDLVKLQNSDGGFSWYSGYPSSYCTSVYILKNLGKMNLWLKDNIKDYQIEEQKTMVSKLVNYIDNEVNKYWRTDDDFWTNFVLDYLDTRNYWEKQFPLKDKGATLKTQIIAKAKKADITDFTFFGLHRAALLFDDYGVKDVSKKLMTYLKETSTESETQGVYWKQNLNDWGWYSSKTVNHAGALEAFQKLSPSDINFIEEMKIWLITQKEVNFWGSSRGTAEVIFTILNSGKSWTSAESDKAEILWGNPPLSFGEGSGVRTTGYIKQSINSNEIDKNLATVSIKKESAGIVQGGLFWQYYEDLDKIKSSENYVSITKELYRKIKTENGEELQKITENSPLKIGDKVSVRMILNTDRNMEFIHLKDMRAAGFEPLDVISKYQWKNSLGYYQSTKDASTNFYIQYLPKGKYVFEYDYICNAAGTFSNGITTLQNYYAPQMNAHTNGTKVEIE